MADDEEKVESYAYLQKASMPHSLDVQVSVVYDSSQRSPEVTTATVRLPLKLIVKPCPPIKDADFKVTISTNKPAVSLLDLFSGQPYSYLRKTHFT